MSLDSLNKSVVDIRYLYRWLLSRGFSDVVTGSSQPQITQSNIRRVDVPIPPLDEQRRIAAILDQADCLRRRRREAITKLDRFAASLLFKTFGEQAAAGAITRSRLESLIRFDDRINYGVVQPGEPADSGVPLIRVENVVANDFRNESLRKILPSIEAKYVRSRLRGDEVLVACVGSIGAVALSSKELTGFNIARAVARVPLDPAKADSVFIAEFLRGPLAQRYFKSETRTVAQPTLNIGQLCDTPIDLPPLQAQRAFAAGIAEIDKLKAAQRAHIAKLDVLFASLQNCAFNGKLSGNVGRPFAKLSA